MEDQVKFEGVTVRLGGREYVIPALSLNQMRKHWADLCELNKGVKALVGAQVSDEDMAQAFKNLEFGRKIIFAAMSRNYPDLDDEEFGNLVDMWNFRSFIPIVTGQSRVYNPGPGPAAEKSIAP